MANIELDGANKKIKVDSGDLTLDVPGDIVLDADGGDIVVADGGTNILKVTNSSSDVVLQPQVDAKDIIFKQYDGTTVATVEDNGTFNVPANKLAIGGTAVTSTAAELNIMDGVTSTAAELNILDGVTSTAAELNIMDGGTSATSTTLADADRVVVNDAGTMKQVAMTDVKTYIGGGTLVEVAQSSISAGSNTAAVEFSNIFSSSYNTYFVRISKIRFVGNTTLQMRFYSDTSTTEYSGAYYDFVTFGYDDGGNREDNPGNGENRFYITQAIDYDQPADGGATGYLYIDNPLANDNFSVTAMGQFGYRNTSDVWSSVQFAGKYSGSSPRYGFKLYGSENVEYADITVYGVAP